MAIPIVRTDFELSSIYKSLKKSYSNEELSLAKVEDDFKIFTNKNYNIFFPKLRFGMEATFRSVFSNELIGVPTYTCSVVPHSVALSGNNIKFYDSNKHNLTTELYEKDLSSYIVTPWYGSPLDEDLLHSENSFGDFSHLNILDKKYTNNNFLATFYSFSSGKPISSIGGGLVSTNSKDLYLKVKSIRDSEFGEFLDKKVYFKNLFFSLGGYFFNSFYMESIKIYLDDNSYLDFLREPLNEISLGGNQTSIDKYSLAMLKERIIKYEMTKKNILEFWNEVFDNYSLKLLNGDDWSNSHLILKIKDRDILKNKLRRIGIQSSYGANYLNHKLIPYKNINNVINFPNATDHYENILQLPINLSEISFSRLINKKTKINEILKSIYG
tara:strand:- start:2724 stop:3875 length:1152 start_codon:yes stop_codon:yes gene_type:complete